MGVTGGDVSRMLRVIALRDSVVKTTGVCPNDERISMLVNDLPVGARFLANFRNVDLYSASGTTRGRTFSGSTAAPSRIDMNVVATSICSGSLFRNMSA